MARMQEVIERQANMLDMVQQQAMANEAKLEISAMTGASSFNSMPSGPSFGGGGGVGVGMPTVASAGVGSAAAFDNYDTSQDATELTYKEQHKLTAAINKLEGGKLDQVLKIIRADTGVGEDQDEVMIGFDELPIKTQRKLQAFLFKPPKAGGGGGGGGGGGRKPVAAKAKAPPKTKAPAPRAATSAATSAASPAPATTPAYSPSPASAAVPAPPEVDAFAFNADLSGFDDEVGMDGDPYAAATGDAGGGANAGAGGGDEGDGDDLWAGAQQEASHNQAVLQSQQKREAEVRTAQDAGAQQRLAAAQEQEAATDAKKLAASQAASLADAERAKKEKAESDAQREQMRRERDAVEATAAFDAGAIMMQQPDSLDSPANGGSLSPSGSDYGF